MHFADDKLIELLSGLETKIEQLQGDVEVLMSSLEIEEDAQDQAIEQLPTKVEGHHPTSKLDKILWLK